MATKKSKANRPAEVLEAFKILEDLNPEAAYLDDNSLSTVTEWIDTGCMSLNAIISGSLNGGIPMGRITGFIGPESCGKTLMCNKIIANAQKDRGMYVAYFDSEGALDEGTATRLGADASKIKHAPVEITEKCRNQIVQFLDKVVATKQHGKYLIIIDSLGNLVTAQEKKKMDEGVETADMGNRAKVLKSMLRAITHAASRANCPVVFTNHIYDDPSALHPSAIKNQAGGSGPKYMPSVVIQLAKKTEKAGKDQNNQNKNKDANDESTVLAKGINGLTIRALTTKNRFVPPFLEIEMYLNFRTGLNRYSGLLELAESLEVLTKKGHQHVFEGETIGYFKNWKTDINVWNKILPVLEEKLKTELCFASASSNPDGLALQDIPGGSTEEEDDDDDDGTELAAAIGIDLES